MAFETEKFLYVPATTQKRWTNGKRPVRLVVIHSMEAPEKGTTAEAVANYFHRPDGKTSAHICIDNDSAVQCVLDNNIAAAAPGANTDGIHLELAGYANQTEAEWLDQYGVQLLNRAANITAQYLLKYGLPAVHLTNAELEAGMKGIVGHYQVTQVYKRSTHLDPGPNFVWSVFLEMVKEHVSRLTNAAS